MFTVPTGMTVRHYRPIILHADASDSSVEVRKEIRSCGGATVAYRAADAGKFAVGIAYCHPTDNFRGLPGVHKAVGRLTQYEQNGYKARDAKGKLSLDATDKQFLVAAENEEALLNQLDQYMAVECGYRRR